MKFSILKNTGNTLYTELQPVMKNYNSRNYYDIKKQLQSLGEIIREAEETLEDLDKAEQQRLKEYRHVGNDSVRFI